MHTADARSAPLHVSKHGSDRSACTKSRPCKSFGRAYEVARAGQVVLVRGGHYRAQRIRFDPKGTRDVIIRPASGRKVVVAGLLDIQWAQHLEVRGLRVKAWRAVGTRDVTLRSLVTKWFSIQGGSGLRVLGGRAGPALNRSNLVMAATRNSPHAPTSVKIDGLTVQGNRRTSAGPPVGCLDVRAADGLVVRNSRVFDCGDFGIRFPESDPAGPARNVIVENNIVSCCRVSTEAISLDGGPSTQWTGILIRNNSVVGSLSAGSSGYLSGVGVYANIASDFVGCGQPGLVADYNVWGAGAPCGSEDVVGASGFVDPGTRDFDLVPGAAAIDIASVDTASRTDIEGNSRPVGRTSDAGAKESRSSAIVAAFPLNEVAGTVASDASGEDNAGVVTGATWTSKGRFGGALSFDGASDWVTVLDDPSLDLTDAMTVEAWVKPSLGSSVWRTVLMKERTGGLAYGLYSDSSTGQPSGNVDVGTELDARAPASLPVNAWTHVAATYDGSALNLFLNGKQVSSRPVSGNLMSSSSPLRLGGNSVWDEWFVGSIDEVRVYRRVLSLGEVKKDMSSPIRLASDTTSPSAPLGLASTGQTGTSVSVSWAPSVDDSGVAGYGLYRDGVLDGSSVGTTYTFAGLTCGTTYTFAVDAYDSAGNRSAQASVAGATDACPPPDTTAPSEPGSVSSTGATQTSISVSWNASTDNVAVTGYQLFRNGTAVGSSTGLTYSFGSLACGTSYTLGVEALDAAGNRSTRATVSASTSGCPAPDTSAPSTPSGFSSTGATQTSISVSWNASTDNVGVSGYGLYRGGTSVGSTNASTRTYTYSGLTCGSSYTLAVDATDAAGNRSTRATVSASTSACAPGTALANLWVDTNGGTCTRQASAAAYADAEACSWDQANDRCQAGDTVGIRAGSYGDVKITGSNGRTGPGVCTFQPAAGETVTVRALDNGTWSSGGGGGNFITFNGPVRAQSFYADYTSNVTVDGWDIDAGGKAASVWQPFHVEGITGTFTLRNSKVHNSWNANSMMVLHDGPFVLDNNDIYDNLNDTDGAIHDECLYAYDVDDMTMTRNHFWSCTIMDVFLTGDTGGSLASNWFVENNIFEAPLGSAGNSTNALLFSGGTRPVKPDGFVVEYNTFGSSGLSLTLPDSTPTANGLTVRGNYFHTNSPCGIPNTSYSYNVTPTGTNNCGGAGAQTFALASLTGGFVNFHGYSGNNGAVAEPAGDYHLRSTSPLVNAGNPSNHPAIDRDGTLRSNSPEVGAYEFAAETTPPSTPTGLASTGATQTSISVSWNASTDNVAVTGYQLFRNGTAVGSSAGLTYSFGSLACGTSYTLGVEAYDAAGNRSTRATVSASTSGCPAPDTTAPSTPSGLASTGATQTSISVSWNASTDNVGVSGYGLYRGGTSVGSTNASTRTYTYSGLTCGSSYTLAVDATDAAGNRSSKASLSASTSACAPPPSGSANLWIDLNGGSCARQATPATYADAQACGSFDAANDKCESGDLVLVKAGAYPDQTVTGSNGRTAACTIKAASGETVDFHTLTTSGNWLTVKDMMSDTGVTEHLGIAGCAWCSTGSHVTLDNVDFPGKWAAIEIGGGDSVTWKNSELGTAGNTADRLCGKDDEPARMSNASNVVIDHIVFHPFRGEENPGNCGGDVYHLETWRLWDSNDGVLFSNNHFDDSNGDDSFTISSSKGGCGGCPDNKNLRFVNNYFGDKCCGYAGADIGFGDGRSCVGFVFAYNFFHSGGAGLFNNCSSESGMVYVGNMGFNSGGCPVSGTNAANLWIGTTHGNCAGNTWLAGGPDNWSSYRLGADGMHLTSLSPSVDAAETSLCGTWTARLDIDADARTGTCDAGPDEYVP